MRRLIIVGKTLAGVGLLYLLLVAGFYIAMRQPPERFGAIMSKFPMPAMMILPFKPLWMSARAGRLACQIHRQAFRELFGCDGVAALRDNGAAATMRLAGLSNAGLAIKISNDRPK